MSDKFLENLLNNPNQEENKYRRVVKISNTIKQVTVPKEGSVEFGGHYNTKSSELFHVTKGALYFRLEYLFGKERKDFYVHEGNSLLIPIYVAHKMKGRPGSEFLIIASKEFNVSSDVHMYELDFDNILIEDL